MSFSFRMRGLRAGHQQDATTRKRHTTRRKGPHTALLFLEQLEDRCVLSPLLNVANLTLSGSYGAVVSNTGTFSDTTPGATLSSLKASFGTVTQNGNTWSWSETTPQTAPQTAPVTIYATDSNGQTTQGHFWLNVGQVFWVKNTLDDGSPGSLRSAINQVKADPTDSTAHPDLIAFDIPANDQGHVYYQGPGVTTVVPATASDDSQISDINTAWAHSWWRIQLQGTAGTSVLPAITSPVIIDGYTQGEWQNGSQGNGGQGTMQAATENTLARSDGDNRVLRIQLDGFNLPPNAVGPGVGYGVLLLQGGGSTVRGLDVSSYTNRSAIELQSLGGNSVQGNFLGTDISGTIATNTGSSPPAGQPAVDFSSNSGGPAGRGVLVDSNSTSNFIGTNGDGNDDFGERNLISGNSRGVTLDVASSPGYSNIVAGNFIGTDASGMQAIPNWGGVNTGVGQDDIIGVKHFLDIGAAAEGNLISGNRWGVMYAYTTGATTGPVGPAETSGQVAGNLIGTDRTGVEALQGSATVNSVQKNFTGNYSAGIAVANATQLSRIGGGDAQGLGNTIAYTYDGPGVWIFTLSKQPQGSPTGISVEGNSIHDNMGLGIDLGGDFPLKDAAGFPLNGGDGVTLNDPSQMHVNSSGYAQPNYFQNFPVLTSASSSATGTTISGTLQSTFVHTFQLDFYSNAAPGHPDANHITDPNLYGEGQMYLGSAYVTTDGSGNASFTANLPTPVLAGQGYLTATATDITTGALTSGDTSEFSADFLVPGGNLPPVTSANLQTLINHVTPRGPAPTVFFQAPDSSTADTILNAVNGLAPQSNPVNVYLTLGSGTYTDVTASPPSGVTLVITGNGKTTIIVGQSPALTVGSGNVIVTGVTLTTATDAPTILVTGGSLTLRNDVVQESTGSSDPAIEVTGGTLDLGTTSSPGNNTINVNGSGQLLLNTTANLIPAFGNTFAINGGPQAAPTLSFTSLASNAPTTVFGQSVTFTATVLANDTGTPSGTVDFVDTTTGIDLGSVPLSGGVATLTTAALTAGSHSIVASYGGDPTYLPSNDGVLQTVNPAMPIFSLVAPPTIIDGTSNTQITGAIAAGSLIPPSTENVTITVNGVSYVAAINPDGTFAVMVPTASLGTGSYTIGYFYAGDTNFISASATANMDVTNGVLALFNQSQAKHAGSTVPIQIELVSASGQDVSSASTTVTALGMAATTDTTDTEGSIDPSLVGALQPVQAAGNSNPNNVFREQGGTKPFYMYNLQTPTGLTAGTYRLYFQVLGDPLWHWVTFSVD
jgi:hypothetical protein